MDITQSTQSPIVKPWIARAAFSLTFFGLFFLVGCNVGTRSDDKTTELVLWLSWTGFEGEAFREIVSDYNATQAGVKIRVLNVSKMERKLLLATAGGNPPDISQLRFFSIPVYAENNALTPLDQFASEAGIRREDFLKDFWDICVHKDTLWALPTLASVTALHWNKKMFREAGLDPDQPPRSIEELEAFNNRITRYREDGSLDVIGHLPNEPGWWQAYWFYWFGGSLWDGDSRMTLNTPENLETLAWVGSYPERFGKDKILLMKSGFGNFASPQNAFIQGRVAMVMQGTWMDNFIRKYGPSGFEYGVAPFPLHDPDLNSKLGIAEPDTFVIPAGARHPREAFRFLAYLSSRKPLEKLALRHRKMTSLKVVSKEFVYLHPHPHIKAFIDIAFSGDLKTRVKLVSEAQLNTELENLVGLVLRGRKDFEVLLEEAENRQQKILDRHLSRWNRVAERRKKEWGGNP